MLIDPQTGKLLAPHPESPAAHYHLLLDQQTGLHHANLEPESFKAHEHQAHQSTVPFNQAKGVTSYHSLSGRNKTRQVQVGQCYIVPSKQPHGLTLDHAGELVNFYISPEFIETAIPETADSSALEVLELHISDDLLIRQLAATVRTDRLLHEVSNKLLLESVLNVLAVHLVNSYATTHLQIPVVGKLPSHLLTQVKEYIAANETAEISVTDLANITGYSSVHFTRMFKKSTGQTPHEYLIQHRIAKAKQLLADTELLIVQVAYQSGFSSHAHFTTQFCRLTGVTPKAYRSYSTMPNKKQIFW